MRRGILIAAAFCSTWGGSAAVAADGWFTLRASAYSPADAGSRTACGDAFGWSSNVVAHRSLPCGTRLAVAYRGRVAITTVRDRGPYIAGRDLDLGPAVWRTLGASSAIGWGDRHVAVRILPARPKRPVQTRAGRQYPPRRVFARLIERRVDVLIRKFGAWPPPVWDATLTGYVAGWVLPQPPGSVRNARATCAPAGRRTAAFACRVSSGSRLLHRQIVFVREWGGVELGQ